MKEGKNVFLIHTSVDVHIKLQARGQEFGSARRSSRVSTGIIQARSRSARREECGTEWVLARKADGCFPDSGSGRQRQSDAYEL